MASLKGVCFVPQQRQPPPSTGGDNNEVLGDWVSVDIEPNYNRTVAPDYKDQKLFYVKDNGDGVERLVHVYIDTNATIRRGRVDGTTLVPTLNHSISLQNDVLAFGNASNIAGGYNNELFVYARGKNPVLSAITLTTSSNNNNNNSSGPTIKTFPSMNTNICQNATKILSTTWRSSYHLLCLKVTTDHGRYNGELTSIENTTMATVRYVNINSDVYAANPILDHFVSIGSGNSTIQGEPLAMFATKYTFGTITVGALFPGNVGFGGGFFVRGSSGDQKDVDPTLVATVYAVVLLGLFAGLYFFQRVRRFRKQQLALKHQLNGDQFELKESLTMALPSAPSVLQGILAYESVQPSGLTTHQRPTAITSLGVSTE